MHSLIQSNDLLHIGHQLIKFADVVYKEKNRSTIVKHFYEQLYQWAFCYCGSGDFMNSEKRKYFICNKLHAAVVYAAIAIPPQKTPVKSINEIKTFGEFILSHYTMPVGECISETSLKNILQYLDEKYLFSSKVFSNIKATFVRVNNSHKDFNSECLITNTGKDIIFHFFLYHMKEKNVITPEAVLFHELGHAIHARRFGNLDKVPDDIIEMLQNLCFPALKQLDSATQVEIFADVLSVGLMYQTPYEKYDFFEKFNPKHKNVFKMLVEKIIEDLR